MSEPNDVVDSILDGLSPRQQAALTIVLGAATLKAGLDAAEVPRATWNRWVGEPKFKAALVWMRRETFLETMEDLKGGVRYAVSVQLGLMTSKNEHIRLTASRTVLEHAQRWAETDGLGERMERIEAALALITSGVAP